MATGMEREAARRMVRAFISYAGADRGAATEVAGWIRDDGHEAFLSGSAEFGIPAGADWRERVHDELRAADVVVSIVSAVAIASSWCSAEIGIAESMGCLVVPVRLGSGPEHPLLAHRQHVDHAGDPDVARTQVLTVLRGLAGDTRSWSAGDNPYPGLQPFQESSAPVFFGRGAEIRDLANRIRSSTGSGRGIVVVTGASGCGKSSLLNAGLLPMLAGDPGWLAAGPCTPGDEPVAALAPALAAVARRCGLDWAVRDVVRTLASDVTGLRTLVGELAAARFGAPGARMLVAVDQAEELLTRTSPVRREWFARQLRAASGPARFVLLIRAEFLDDLRGLAGLADVAMDVLALAPLSREMLPQVIEGPARLAGLRLEPELVPGLVRDTGTGDALPLLAFTLRNLAEGATRGDTLTVARYTAIGGVRGALTRHADAALRSAHERTGLGEERILAALVRLTSIDETGRWARRAARADGFTDGARAALLELVERRLLVITGGEDGTSTMTVAHEALLTTWLPLRRAIGERRVALQAARTVEQTAADWARDGRAEHHLWPAPRLAATREALGLSGRAADDPTDAVVDLDPAASDFLAASQARAQAQRRRTTVRRRLLVLVLSALLVLTTAAGGTAVWQRQQALDGQRRSVAQSLLAQADEVRERDPRSALRLAGAAMALEPNPASQASLIQSLASAPAIAATLPLPGAASEVAVAPDGRTAFIGTADGEVAVWDIADPHHPAHLTTFVVGAGEVSLALSRDARTLAAASWASATVTLWNVDEPTRPDALGGPLVVGDDVTVQELGFSPTGDVLAVTDDTSVRFFDVARPDAPQPLGPALTPDPSGRYQLVFGKYLPDGRTFVTSGQVTTFWDVTDPAEPRRLSQIAEELPGLSAYLAFSPDGRMLVIGDGAWDISDRSRPRPAGTIDIPGVLTAGTFTPDSRQLVVADPSLTLFDVTRDGLHPRSAPLVGHSGYVAAAAFAAPSILVTAGQDTTAIVWDLSAAELTSPRPGRLPGHKATYSPAQQVVAAPLDEGLPSLDEGADHPAEYSIVLWDVTDAGRPQLLGPPLDHVAIGNDPVFSRDGRLLAAGGADRSLLMWDVSDPARPRPLTNPIPTEAYSAVALSPDGTLVAVLDSNGGTLWTRTSAGGYASLTQLVVAEEAFFPMPDIVDFSPDGTHLAIAHWSRGITVWDLTRPAEPRRTAEFSTGDPGGIGLRFLSDSSTLAISGARGVTLWDIGAPSRRPRPLSQPFADPSAQIAVSADGRTLAAVTQDPPHAVLWDLTDRSRPRPLGPALTVDSPFAPSFSPDLRTLALSDGDAVGLWSLDHILDIRSEPGRRACVVAGGPLPADRWDDLAPDLDRPDACAG